MYWFNISNALHNIQCTLYSTTDHNVHCIIFAQRFKLYCLHVSTIYLNLIISNNSLHSYSRNPLVPLTTSLLSISPYVIPPSPPTSHHLPGTHNHGNRRDERLPTL